MAMSEVSMPFEIAAPDAEAWRHPSDQQLLERFVAHRDERAFSCLVERYGRAVWRVCRRVLYREHDVEDAFQAVFLVLSKNAAAIRKTGAVGSWLYGVAHRTAVRAKQNSDRRRDNEARVVQAVPERPAWSEAAARELHLMLDEEMDRLAEKYRAPFVLCCLEGMSKGEAARELGWKEGTVSSRLAKARKLLKCRLARRGVTLSAVLAVGALAKSTASAAVPALVMHSTVQAALAPLAGPAACASPTALSLANGIYHTMVLAKVKAWLSACMILVTLLTGTGLVASQLQSETPRKTAAPQEAAIVPGPEEVLALAFSPDGTKLATAGASQRGKYKLSRLIFWDVASAKEIKSLDGIAGIRALAYSPDGKTIACGEFGGTLRLRDAETGQAIADLKGHQIGVNGVAFSPDGVHLVSAGLDKKIKLWDWHARKELQGILGLTEVYSVAFFHDGHRFTTSSRDATARIWDIDALGNVAEKYSLRGHRAGVEMVAISPDDKEVATASWDGAIKIWDADSGVEKARLGDDKTRVFSVAYSPDGKYIAGGLGNGKIHVWNAKTHQLAFAFDAHLGNVWGLAFTPDSKTLASCSSDSMAKLWNMSTGKEIATFRSGFALQTLQPAAIDSKVRASVLTDSSLEPVQVATVAVQPPPVPAPVQAPVEQSAKSHWQLWLALLIGVSVVGFVLLGIWARKRANRKQPNEASAVSIALSCSNCDKRLKVKAAMAGKRIKCPQCAHRLEVPAQGGAMQGPAKFKWASPVVIGTIMLVVGLLACIVIAILAINESQEKAVVENKKIDREVTIIKEQSIDVMDVPKSFPGLDDQGLSKFKGMLSLRDVKLNNAPITDAGMSVVNSLTNLQHLSLSGTKITDAGLAQLKDLKDLQELRLDKLAITDAGLANLKYFPKLKMLTLWRDPVTSAGMVHVRNLPLLEHISLDETSVGDDGLKELHGLTNLREVRVWRTQVTAQGIEAFKKALPSVKVVK
jgi:RNA polymerase sigma factor (sigma-70 family)